MNPPTTNRSLIGDLRRFPRTFWVLFIGVFINRFGMFVVPFMALYLTSQGYTPGQAGTGIAAFGVGSFFASFLGGYLTDRIGRRNTIALSMYLGASGMICLALAQSYWAIVLAAAYTGFAGCLSHPATQSLVADLVPADLRLRAYATLRLAVNTGFALGASAAGILAKYSYTWLFIGDAITSATFATLALFFLPHGIRTSKEKAGWGPALRSIRKDHHLLVLILTTAIVAMVFDQLHATFGLQVTSSGFTTDTYGFLLGLNGALIVLFELPLTSYLTRFNPRRVIALGYVLLGLGFVVLTVAQSLPALILCVTLYTIGEMLWLPTNSMYIASLAPEDMRGRYMGTLSFSWSFATIFGPALGLRLFGFQPVLLWASCGLLTALAALLLLVLPRTNATRAKMAQPLPAR
ncbi:MAG: MFS transporter [Verrucomicrobiota bacterium]